MEALKCLRDALFSAVQAGNLEGVKECATKGAKLNGDWANTDGLTPLEEAWANNRMNIAEFLINAGADVNETNKNGLTALQNACVNGQFAVAKHSIDAGADVNKTGKFLPTALYIACENGRFEFAKLLINAGADVNKTNMDGFMALQGACRNCHSDVATLFDNAGKLSQAFHRACEKCHAIVDRLPRFFFKAGMRANLGRTPLQEACCNGNLDVARLLIDAGANVNKTDKVGQTPLLAACENGHVQSAKLLVCAGADVNKNGHAALREACWKGDLGIAKLLIDAGADVNKAGKFSLSALYGACANGDVEIAKLLIKAGAHVNEANGRSTALEGACRNGYSDVAKLLIDAGAKVNNERQALFSACKKGYLKIAKLLIYPGVDVNKTDEDGRTALLIACLLSHVDISKILIRAGANVNKTNLEGRTALQVACRKGHLKIVNLLIDAKADFNKTNLEGLTALLMACLGGHLVIATLLVEAGADVNKTDAKGNSVLHFLAKYSYRISDFFMCFDLVKLILSKEPTLIDRSGEDGLLPHETLCLSEVRTILFKEWTNHRYNKLYSQGTTKQTKIKICIIGKAGAGKTTLVKTLKNIYWKDGGDDKRTASMDLSTANIKSAGDVVFCDFAGQPFFHKTHGLFFSESTTAFLLVVDLTENENELKTWSHFFCSFVKCSVVLNEKANFLVVGSKKDLLPSEKIGEIKLRQVFAYVRQNFGRWFNFYEKHFVLNCHDRKSTDLDLLRESIKEVKALTLKAGKEVPIIVEEATASFLPTLRDPFRKGQLFFHRLRSFFSINNLKEEVRQRTLSVIKNHPETKREEVIHFMESSVFEKVMADCLYPGLTVEVQKLLVEFLQGIGEIFVIQNKIILDPTWLCQNIIGPLLSPLDSDFPVSLCCCPPGTTTKEDIQSALEAFNEHKWENIDETIWLLCHLEICYPLPGMRNTYRFPALVEEKRQSEVWCENSEMTVYVGRRVRRAKETDIITPGTMPFLQCHVHNVPCFHGLQPVVWQGGLMIRDTIDGVSVEGMITLQEVDKALDFIVRGPVHSERECVKLLNNLMITGEEVLRKRSPGTDSLLWYISSTELKQLKEFPLAYKEATVDAKIEISAKSSASVSKGMIKDSLKDLLALRDNHIDLLSYKTRCAIITCLDKDDAGREVLKGYLPGLSEADQVECKTAAELISTWSENLIATAQCFGDAARRSRLPFLLALLSGDGAIELSADENVEAKEDLAFIRTRSPSAIKRRRGEQVTQLCSSLSERNDEEISCLFDEIYLDNPPTALELFRAAERIQPVWRRIGKILGPEPFQFYQLHAFEEKRNDQDRALDMLDAWANKFGKRATRRHFITAMKNVGCSTETIASIFSGQTK